LVIFYIFAAHYLVIAAGLLWYVKFLLSHRQLADEPAEIIVPNPKGNNNNPIKPKLQGAETKEENHKRIRNVALMALASIVTVGMAIVIYFSLFSFSSISFFFPFLVQALN
jgi:hypothetical protein